MIARKLQGLLFAATPLASGRRIPSIAVLAATLVASFAFVSAASAQARALHITWSPKVYDLGEFTCADDGSSCTGSFGAKVRSNLSTSVGTGIDYITILPVNGAFDPCNRAIDRFVFAFPEGELFIHSDHIDCPAWIRPLPDGDSPGPRVYTEFWIAGGTGAFAGATGDGTELGFGGGRQGAIVFNGTLILP